jgi:hypothetical protein
MHVCRLFYYAPSLSIWKENSNTDLRDHIQALMSIKPVYNERDVRRLRGIVPVRQTAEVTAEVGKTWEEIKLRMLRLLFRKYSTSCRNPFV